MTDAQSGTVYSVSDLTAYNTTNGGHDWSVVTSAAGS